MRAPDPRGGGREHGSAGVARRVEIDDSLSPLPISRRILHEVCQHALEAVPEECCGLLLGGAGRRYEEVARCRNDMTQRHRLDPAAHPRDGHRAYWMNELDYQRVDAEARARGRAVTGIYHSHVGADAYLSELDIRYAESALFPFPESDQLVVAVVDGRVTRIGLFLAQSRGGFEGRLVVASAE